MSQILSGRLSIDQIARLWVAETEKVGFGAKDLATDLIDAALRGEFQYSPKGDWRSSIPDEPLDDFLPIPKRQTSEHTQACATWSSTIFPPTGAPTNYDPRLAMLIETFDRDGNVINSSQLQTYVDARKNAPGAIDQETRQLVAHDVFLSVEGFRRWCDEPEFAGWAKLRGLLRPKFIELVSGDGTGQASAVDQKPEEADAPSPSPPQKNAQKPRRGGGRKKGSGSFAAKDGPLLEVMKPLITNGTSHWAAAMTVVSEAAGAGTDESKAKRLVARFKEWEKNNSV